MKKLFCILFTILLLIPLTGMAAPNSPTARSYFRNNAQIPFELITDPELIEDITDLIPLDEVEGYLLYEIFYVILDQPYKTVAWDLSVDLEKVSNVKAVLIGESIVVQDAPIKNKQVLIDFTGLEGVYYVYLFIQLK